MANITTDKDGNAQFSIKTSDLFESRYKLIVSKLWRDVTVSLTKRAASFIAGSDSCAIWLIKETYLHLNKSKQRFVRKWNLEIGTIRLLPLVTIQQRTPFRWPRGTNAPGATHLELATLSSQGEQPQENNRKSCPTEWLQIAVCSHSKCNSTLL